MVFLGDVPQSLIPTVQEAMDEVQGQPLSLTIANLGKFHRPDGDIYWLGVRDHPPLKRLYAELRDALIRQGFSVENRAFKPHLTLGRRVRMKPGVDLQQVSLLMGGIEVSIDRLTLMRSHRIAGKLTYTPIYQKKLGKL